METLRIREYDLETMPLSCTMVFIAPPAYGKTTMIETIMYHSRHLFPTGRAWIGTDSSYKDFCRILGPLYVSNYYDVDEHNRSIMRQNTCINEHGKNHTKALSFNVVDDCSSDPKIFKNKQFRAQFKLGSQHYSCRFCLGMQYCIDMPPDVRQSISLVFIGRINEIPEREKVYKQFCGIVPRDVFEELMDDVCQDHTFLVINRRGQSNDWRDNVFYLRTEVLPKDWKFGCKEHWDWNKARYNTSYKEVMDL